MESINNNNQHDASIRLVYFFRYWKTVFIRYIFNHPLHVRDERVGLAFSILNDQNVIPTGQLRKQSISDTLVLEWIETLIQRNHSIWHLNHQMRQGIYTCAIYRAVHLPAGDASDHMLAFVVDMT